MPRAPTRKQVVAAEIDRYLKRFEADVDGVNKATPEFYEDGKKRGDAGCHRYFTASCYVERDIRVIYISYQGSTKLTLEEAETYLAWLKAGNVGQHYRALRAAAKAATEEKT